jgi:drug/metabolite transporter (DMT)-like permease
VEARDLFAISTKTWIACLVALCGVGVMGLDGNESGLLSNSVQDVGSGVSDLIFTQQFLSQGDFFVIGSAIAYSFHCIRLEKYAKETRAVTLAAFKATTETVLSVLLVIGLLLYNIGAAGNKGAASSNFFADFASESSAEISNFFSVIPQRLAEGSIPTSILIPAILAVLWTGLVTCGYTITAQSFGQSRVKPSDANLIYTFQPVWTAIIAFLLLGESLGPSGFIGGSLIFLAVYLVISSEEQNPPDGSLQYPEETGIEDSLSARDSG